MDTPNPEVPRLHVTPAERNLRVRQFWVTTLWGLLVLVAMVVGQIVPILYLLVRQGLLINLLKALKAADGEAVKVIMGEAVSGRIGLVAALSIIMGVPAVLAVAWLASHFARVPFADYLALRWTSWKNLLLGVFGLAVLAIGWDLMSRAIGREIVPGFDVFKATHDQGVVVVWLLALAFGVAAPIWEEVFARGVLYRGWSQTFLRVPGAIVLSSLAWTLMHQQYDWYGLGEVFCLGLWFGYMRYRSDSTLLAIVIHGLNNFAVLAQAFYLANQ